MKKFYVLLSWIVLIGFISTDQILIGESTSQNILELEQESLRAAADFAQHSVVQIETFGGREIVGDSAVAAGPSSGTVIAADGWIITSLFQFRGDPASITVLLPDGKRKAAKLVARDHARDLALLKIDVDEPLGPAVASPRSSWQVGQWTVALGKTFDIATASRSVGILSATDRIFGRAIQTDCKISPHNYGGPLIDIYGRTMGILAPIDPGIVTEGEVQQWYDAGVGFAIPLDDILTRLPKMMQGEDVYSGKAGVRPSLNDDFRGPVVLAGVAPGTPAHKAGLKAGDTLLKIDARAIRWPNDMRHALGSIDAGDSVKVTVQRDDVTKSFDCQLVRELPAYRMPYAGILPDPSYDGPGVKIRAVSNDSPASIALLKPGQIVRKLGDQDVESIPDFEKQLAFVDYRETAVLGLSLEERNKGELKIESIKMQLKPWPAELEKDTNRDAMPLAEPPESNEKSATGVVSIVMSDVKNQAFAFVPSTYHPSTAHGLILMVPEPGKIEKKHWVDRWEPFCRDHRFIFAMASSADPEEWSLEELEIIKRTMNQIREDYKIDPRRIVVGGIGAGGKPAIVLALQNRGIFRGLWLAGSSLPRGLRMRQTEPLESLAIFLQGNSPAYFTFSKTLDELGYRVGVAVEKYEIADQSVGNAAQMRVQEFLLSLEWF